MDTKTLQFSKTSIPANYKINLKDSCQMNWMEERTEPLFKVFFSTITTFLKFRQSKDAGKVALNVIDFKNNFLMAGIVSYHAPEDDSDENESKGNWSLEFTFNKDDLEGISTVYDIMCTEFVQIAEKELYNMMHSRFSDSEYIYSMLITLVQTMKSFLDANAKENEIVEVEIPNYVIFSVTIEDGEKVTSITPGEILKQQIKDDTIL